MDISTKSEEESWENIDLDLIFTPEENQTIRIRASGEPNPPPTPDSLPAYVPVAFKPMHGKLFRDIFNLILGSGVFFNNDEERRKTPYNFKTPEQLSSMIDFRVGKRGVDQSTLLGYMKKVIAYSPHLSHPFHLAKNGAGWEICLQYLQVFLTIIFQIGSLRSGCGLGWCNHGHCGVDLFGGSRFHSHGK